jgi:hypothetical protein
VTFLVDEDVPDDEPEDEFGEVAALLVELLDELLEEFAEAEFAVEEFVEEVFDELAGRLGNAPDADAPPSGLRARTAATPMTVPVPITIARFIVTSSPGWLCGSWS